MILGMMRRCVFLSSPDHVNTHPKEYAQPVMGMLYQTMGSLQTWFEDFVSYGIQLLPLTVIGEERDDPTWAADLYQKYEKSPSFDRRVLRPKRMDNYRVWPVGGSEAKGGGIAKGVGDSA